MTITLEAMTLEGMKFESKIYNEDIINTLHNVVKRLDTTTAVMPHNSNSDINK